MDLLEVLSKIGFTRHESVLYVTLCKEGELTGYEAAKISGLPRSNVYLALAGLVEKGGAYISEGEVTRYTPIPAAELVANTSRQMGEILDYLETHIPERKTSSEPYITITGKMQIVNKMKNIISQAQERIYLSFAPRDLELVVNELTESIGKGLKVVIITTPPFKLDGAVLHYIQKQSGQIRLISDSANVLTGELGGEAEPSCLYSRNKNLVDLIKNSLTNEIELIVLQSEKNSR